MVRRARNLGAHLRRLADEERVRSLAVTHGRLDYPKAAVQLRLTSKEEFHRLHSCAKEPWTVRWIEEHLKPGEVLYDVGANVGAYSLLAAVAVPDARVVAFEPGPANFAALCANVELNDVAQRVMPLPFALGDGPRSAALGGSDSPGASHSLSGPSDEAITVLVDRLDDLVTRFDLPSPDHMKLDVDGGELEVLAGAAGLLASGSVKSAMVELDPARAQEVIDSMAGLGFALLERASGADRARGAPTYGLFARR